MLIAYTICFCIRGEQVLMLYRSNPPNARRWNGLGGKIEAVETPLENIQREIMEEAEIDLRLAQELHYTGTVTWALGDDPTHLSGGMCAFLAHFAADFPLWPDRPMSEGLLSWKPLVWVCDPNNAEVVSNIPRFLPHMLTASQPQEYRCHYQESVLQTMVILPVD